MMGTWPSVIATNPADPEAPARATLSADPFGKAERALHASRMTSRCRQPKPSRMPRICWTVAWHSTRTRCSRRHGKTAQTMSGCCGKAWPNSLSASPISSVATSRGQSPNSRRASARLAQDDRPAPYAIDAAHLVAYADALIADLAAGAEITPKRLRPRLVAVLPR